MGGTMRSARMYESTDPKGSPRVQRTVPKGTFPTEQTNVTTPSIAPSAAVQRTHTGKPNTAPEKTLVHTYSGMNPAMRPAKINPIAISSQSIAHPSTVCPQVPSTRTRMSPSPESRCWLPLDRRNPCRTANRSSRSAPRTRWSSRSLRDRRPSHRRDPVRWFPRRR